VFLPGFRRKRKFFFVFLYRTKLMASFGSLKGSSFFRVSFFAYKFCSTFSRIAERSDNGARHEACNLT